MNTELKPAAAVEALGIIAGLDWRKLTESDYASFCGAGPDARIAEMSTSSSIRLSNLFDFDLHAECTEMMAIMGGEEGGYQLEIHGTDPEGDSICISIPVKFDNLIG